MTTASFELKVVNRSGQLIAPLPDASLESVSWDLDPTADKMQISLAPDSANAGAIALNKTEIQLWVNEALRWWGIPRSRSGDSKRISVECEGLMTYFFYRFVIEEDLTYTNMEQITIGANLVNYAQSAIQGTNPGLNIGIAGYSASGIVRTRTYTSDRKGSINESLRDFATLDQGFEYSIEIFGSGTRLWTPHYPQRGTYKPLYGLEYGRNVVDYTWKEDATKMATKVDATGGSAPVNPLDVIAGREKQNFIYEDTGKSTEYGVHIAVLPSGARSDLPWLEARARRAVAVRSKPIAITSVTCRQGPPGSPAHINERWPDVAMSTDRYPDLMTNLWPGDEVPVRVDHGAIQVVGTQRIKTKRWNPKGDLVLFDFTSVVD